MRRIIVVALTALAVARCVRAEGFQIRLGFTHAHLRELFFGCDSKGTDGYDRDLDDFAPPPGIDVGYIGFFPPKKMPFFYRDIRSLKGPHQWKLYVKVFKDKPITVSWDKETFPKGWMFTIVQGKNVMDMREKKRVELAKSTTLLIRAAVGPTTPGTPDETPHAQAPPQPATTHP